MGTGRIGRAVVAVAAGCVLATAGGTVQAGEFPSQNVALRSHIDLDTFEAASGNDCWGYVSPSGREYALMGLDNKVAFVEITNPANAVWFASIAHGANLWGDIKVYQDVAYAVTEGSGSGIQVIDMSDIDNHVVTLVQTITPPSRSHNIAVDTVGGQLYTSGSSGGSATTIIFDLTNPLDPVEIGGWTDAYEHDVQIVTVPSGPFAGHRIMFGSSTGLGVDIVDVTDPLNPILLSRTPYPNVAYCHQSWTEDLNYLYVNDELDSIPRTTVLDISDLENPIVLGDFGSGLSAIDHNLYVHNGFIFEANYRSGLRIFDSRDNPAQPTQVGWFDTYPANDNSGFNGAWSCYPFFPSGTVIVSDITDGLFVLDPGEALGAGPSVFACCTPSGAPQGNEGCTNLTEENCLAITDGAGNNAVWQDGLSCGDSAQDCVLWECQFATGACDEPHGGLGCNLPLCCDLVCGIELGGAFCCDVAWDQSCVDLAMGPGGCNPAPARPDPDSATDIVASVTECENDADCRLANPSTQATCVPGAGGVLPGVCYVARNRFVSVMPNPTNTGTNTARRVSLQTESGPVVLGWMGAAIETQVNGPEVSPQNRAEVVSAPLFRDWSEFGAAIHLGDCEISPGQTYLIQSIAAGADLAIELNYSEPLMLPTVAKWGDVSGVDGMPDNVSNLADVFEVVLGFQGLQNTPAVWLELEGSGDPANVPDFGTINLADVFRDVQAFQGDSYPFSPPCGCSVPSPCP